MVYVIDDNERIEVVRVKTYKARIHRTGTSTEAMTTRSASTLSLASDLRRTRTAM